MPVQGFFNSRKVHLYNYDMRQSKSLWLIFLVLLIGIIFFVFMLIRIVKPFDKLLMTQTPKNTLSPVPSSTCTMTRTEILSYYNDLYAYTNR